MSMLDSFFNNGFKASKCKTLLKLTIPRIKLLRNRREIQLKQMRRDIAKLLETGQEATARIRVEHIIREENMMAAQEIIELFCELIAVRLPIIESQRECPLDLKEAISSVCFAAPRCADLPELLQVQLLFAAKYGKEFLSAATELMPNCGVNRQLIELLSVRAPAPEKKLKLLKEIAVEHELDWDPAASETEFFKPHEDLLNGPMQLVSGSKLPLPDKHDEALNSAPDEAQIEQIDSDSESDIEFPEVPKVSVRPSSDIATAPVIVTPSALAPDPEIDHGSSRHSRIIVDLKQETPVKDEEISKDRLVADRDEHNTFVGDVENKQFVPFISPPSVSPGSFSARHTNLSPSFSRTKSEANVDLQDVLAAAQVAAETAERAAAAARSAASLAQARISELTKKNGYQVPDSSCENPFHTSNRNQPSTINQPELHQDNDAGIKLDVSNLPTLDTLKADFNSSLPSDQVSDKTSPGHQPRRLASMDDDSYFSYPNLFSSQNPNLGSSTHPENNPHTFDK
ncbi:IST1-like protein [Quillaja saponaria]|uniref:IST1-like protein n=1 Tax=Quillaja saponaria TaxID=32244 RepID=A0AAD7M4B6_QUISA|nr:IST1-like protein [Quillaja saponaria]KAJ7969725.1 IST1-like protein [Quillaja saponaria]